MRTLENITYREKLGKRSLSKGLVIVLMYMKKKLWESNQVFLCIPCAVGSLCSRKNLLMEKAFENWKNFFRKAVKSPVPQAYRSSDRSCRCSPSWEQGWGSQTLSLNELYFCYFLAYLHTGDRDGFYMFLRKCSPLLDCPALFCLLLPCFGIYKNNLNWSVLRYSSVDLFVTCVSLETKR